MRCTTSSSTHSASLMCCSATLSVSPGISVSATETTSVADSAAFPIIHSLFHSFGFGSRRFHSDGVWACCCSSVARLRCCRFCCFFVTTHWFAHWALVPAASTVMVFGHAAVYLLFA
ncbi:hypothetical protein GOP47_0023803 [Adiantum capillus-veneris]|uniref:Uncharacterized protein n=1 Tax=Adiantum capillus-veneris TaxID=13818 RepID=A0A9D4Z3P7_ADICA|nr:hypothetical protein GOP47_0023803 [Adiantum capillus-veneris]